MPARLIATAASPAALNACSSMSRDEPAVAGSLGVAGAPGLAVDVRRGAGAAGPGTTEPAPGRRPGRRAPRGVPRAPASAPGCAVGRGLAVAASASGSRWRPSCPEPATVPTLRAAIATRPRGDRRLRSFGTIARVTRATKPPKLDSVGAEAVDAARVGAPRPRARGRRRRAPRPRGRGRQGGHPPLRLHRSSATAAGAGRSPSPGRPRQKTVTVDEVVLLPGDDAVLAPEWVPYRERIRPGDLGPGDLLPTEEDDDRGWCRRSPRADEAVDPRRGQGGRRRARPRPPARAVGRGPRAGRRALVRRQPRARGPDRPVGARRPA